MVDIISEKINAITSACEEMHVESLYLFGSGARKNDYNYQSDLDFLFTFRYDKQGNLLPPYFDYFDLLFRLENITGKNVDLVAEKKVINKYFLQEVQKDRIKIYEHQP